MTDLQELGSGFSSTGMEANFLQHGQETGLEEPAFEVESQRANRFLVLMIFVIALLQERLCAGSMRNEMSWRSYHF